MDPRVKPAGDGRNGGSTPPRHAPATSFSAGLRFVTCGRGLWTFPGNAHYGGPQHSLPNHITRLNYLSDRADRDVCVAHLEYRLVEIRIEFGALRIEPLNAVPFQHLVKFTFDQFNPLM